MTGHFDGWSKFLKQIQRCVFERKKGDILEEEVKLLAGRRM